MFGFLHRNKAERIAHRHNKLAKRMQKTVTRCVDARQNKLMSKTSYNMFMSIVFKKIGRALNTSDRPQLNNMMRKLIDEPKSVDPKIAGQHIYKLIMDIPTKSSKKH